MTTWKQLATVLTLIVASSPALADATAPDQQSALRFLDAYYAALKKHDAPRLESMIAPTAPVVVLLRDDDGKEQRFTLSRAEYLQQIRAQWHFSSNESYTVADVAYHAASGNSPALVTLQESESRTILNSPSGQSNQLELSLGEEGGTVRIIAIKTHTVLR